MSFEAPSLTKRDYLIGTGVVLAALTVLCGMIYAINCMVNYFLPVGCTP